MSEPRCQECGSWDRECSSPTAVDGCGCARCLSAKVAALEEQGADEAALVEALERTTRERDEARERVRYLADGEVITAGIARLVDRQTQTLIDKAKAAKADAARLREARAEVGRLGEVLREWLTSPWTVDPLLLVGLENKTRAALAGEVKP